MGHVGQSGTGKTFDALRKILDSERVIFFDTKGDIGRAERQNPAPRGYVELWGWPAFAKYIARYGGGRFRIIYHPTPGTIVVAKRKVDRHAYEFECMCRAVWTLRNCVFVIDEVWLFTSPGWMPDALNSLILMGRTPGITVLWTAQRPQDVARRLTAQTTSWEIFRVEEPADLDALPRSIPPELRAQIPNLPDRVHLSRDGGAPWALISK